MNEKFKAPAKNQYAKGHTVTDAEKKERAERLAKQWQSPEYREKMSKQAAKQVTSEEERKRRSDAMKARWADQNYRAKMKRQSKELWSNPEYIDETYSGARKP